MMAMDGHLIESRLDELFHELERETKIAILRQQPL
jgi:hypothetical protein